MSRGVGRELLLSDDSAFQAATRLGPQIGLPPAPRNTARACGSVEVCIGSNFRSTSTARSSSCGLSMN